MKRLHFSLLFIVGFSLLFSCRKKNDVIYTSVPKIKTAQGISDSLPLSGVYKGHMAAGKTYTVASGGNITINAGDTLYMDAGVHLYMSPASSIVVKGVFISLGTQDNPNWITVRGLTRTDDPTVAPSNDSAYVSKRLWCGINCDTSSLLLVLKWTHVEYTSANFVGTPPLPSVSGTSHAIFFQNPNGVFVMEDCWMYGSADEVRVSCGKIAIMRNTIEKLGFTGGDGFNVKHGTVGDMAYNLFVGSATNGTKASDKGTYAGPQTNVNMYNNTYINCGYRRNSTGRGGSVNYEEGARGLAYNNLMVNCKYGLRIVSSPPADVANMHYGNSFNYADSIDMVNQFYPNPGYITQPQTSDIPLPSSYLPSTYQPGDTYNAPQLISANNPLFVGYALPATGSVINVAYATGFDFHLKPNSPAAGKGKQDFAPLASVPLDLTFGATDITPPGSDIGCYQLDGTGNKH